MKTKSKPASVSEPVDDSRALLDSLTINPDNLIDAALENTVLFGKAIAYRVKAMSVRKQADMDADMVRADSSLRIRQAARDNNEKITEDGIKSQVTLDAGVVETLQRLSRAEEADETSKLLLEAFRMRRDCIKIVSDLTREEQSLRSVLESSSERMEKIRSNVRKRFPGSD